MANARAQTAIIGCRLAMPDDPRLVTDQPNLYEFSDLPLEKLADQPKTTHYVQIVEVNQELTTRPDMKAFHDAIRDGREISAPFCLSGPLTEHTMQCVVTHVDG